MTWPTSGPTVGEGRRPLPDPPVPGTPAPRFYAAEAGGYESAWSRFTMHREADGWKVEEGGTVIVNGAATTADALARFASWWYENGGPPYPPETWITEIPFDVAAWGDKDVSNYGDPFPTEEDFEQAKRDAAKFPPLPGVPDKRAGGA